MNAGHEAIYPHGIQRNTSGLRLLLEVLLEAMIVRQSPSPRKTVGGGSWPPKSPGDALLSSPSGRRKVQRLFDRSSTSPSPVQRQRLGHPIDDHDRNDSNDDEEDEDEETLRLKLQAIEARLKLKKLQKTKLNSTGLDSESKVRSTTSVRQPATVHQDSQGTTAVQIPVSPTRMARRPASPRSPSRVLLGIDKGLKATDVSLKKPAARRYAQSASERQRARDKQNAGAMQKSFNEKLSDIRAQDATRRQKTESALLSRSKGFGIELHDPAQSDTQKPNEVHPTGLFKGDIRRPTANTGSLDYDFRDQKVSSKVKGNFVHGHAAESTPHDTKLFDAFSKLHLSKRTLAVDTLEGALRNKAIYSIPKLLETVVGPAFDAPDIDGDYVVLGIIAKKSSPYDKAIKRKIDSSADPDENTLGDRSKFMVLHLTDLKWEIDLFLFDTGFERFWKLTVGTIVAILNPYIMPPKPHMRDTGKFSLKLSSSDDTVLEIGSARDLGFCKSIKKDGQQCAQWIDQRHTEFCEFHVNLKVEKARAGRMEVNTMTDMYSDLPANRAAAMARGRGRFFGQNTRRDRENRGLKDNTGVRDGRHHNSFRNETVYLVPPGSGASTAKLFDDEDIVDRGMSKPERQRKRLAAIEKERGLAQKLGISGDGLGATYIRVKHLDSSNLPSSTRDAIGGETEPAEAVDATSLGLMGNLASTSRLSPVMGRKSGTSSSAEAVGWGSAFKRGVPTAKRDGKTSSQGGPSAKKARFMIEEKGIRIPGRDSLSNQNTPDEDDDLDII